MEWAPVIATILGIVLWGLKRYAAKKAETDANEKQQQGRQDIVSGNVDAVQSRIDSVCSGAENNSNAGVKSAEDAQRRISRL